MRYDAVEKTYYFKVRNFRDFLTNRRKLRTAKSLIW